MSATPAHGVPAPSGVVTFLFTDIEGSTRRWEADADGMRKALDVHDQVLRWAVEAHHGWLFKHTGDGVCAAFGSPTSAVDAAVAAQRELELPVRMGIATGEAELRGADYFGTALNRTARVMAAGHGGQILVAESAAVLLSGVDLLNLGSRRLRDLPTAVSVFQVRAPGLRTEFPPLRTLDPTPGNLRPAVTSLIGRESEVAEIRAALGAHRLLTLTGAGGVGKTRLALEVAGQLANEFPDGTWFFDLAAVSDPAAVADAVAAVLGIAQQAGRTMGDSVAAAQEGRLRLLVFDNCEHVRDAAADLAEAIVEQSPTAKILATSREGLGVREEQVWVVPSLDIESAAVHLFTERARNVASRFTLDNADQTTAVVEICRRLDGIPLAIELAASRMASMTAIEVRDRLDQRFRLLVSRRGLARHQTLHQAVAWSYEQLGDDEKALLDRCSVFCGGFDLQSICAVAGFEDCDDLAILDLLDALVRKSLLVADRSAERTRFSMLETLRQFAEERLIASGLAEEAAAAHARYFAGREADVLALWDSPRQRDAYDWFSTELANLRAAFRFAADRGELDIAAAIATYAPFLGTEVGTYEPLAWAEELIEPAQAVEHPRLAALYTMASRCFLVGRTEEAVRYSDRGRAVIADAGHDVPFGAVEWLGASYVAIGRPDWLVDLCRVELRHGRDAHAIIASTLAIALAMAGSAEEAIAATPGLIEAAEAAHNPRSLCYALFAYGYVFLSTRPAAARDALRRGLEVARESGNRANEAHLAVALFRLEAEHGEALAALDYATSAIRNYHDSGNTNTVSIPLAILATFLDRRGRYEAAATIAGSARTELTESSYSAITKAMAHLRDVLGDATYESLARTGAAMSTAAMAAYAYQQIDEARAELERKATPDKS
ncbi:MAG: adenylate/guanylate cyclase domain-containing protein [Mycobacterium sp.]